MIGACSEERIDRWRRYVSTLSRFAALHVPFSVPVFIFLTFEGVFKSLACAEAEIKIELKTGKQRLQNLMLKCEARKNGQSGDERAHGTRLGESRHTFEGCPHSHERARKKE